MVISGSKTFTRILRQKRVKNGQYCFYDMVHIIWIIPLRVYIFFSNFNRSILFDFNVVDTSHRKNLVGLDFQSFDMSRLDEIERRRIFPF